MSRMTLYFKADGDELKLIDIKSSVYTGNVNSYICEFELSCEWENMNVFAVFCVNETAYTAALLKDRTCILPNEVLEEEGEFFVGLYATNGDSDNLKRISTGLISARIEKGCFTDGLTPQIPTPDIWEQLISKTVPHIGDNNNWFVYDIEKNEYVDTGICAVLDAKDIYSKEETDIFLEKKEDISNKVTDISYATNSSYPTANAVINFVSNVCGNYQDKYYLVSNDDELNDKSYDVIQCYPNINYLHNYVEGLLQMFQQHVYKVSSLKEIDGVFLTLKNAYPNIDCMLTATPKTKTNITERLELNTIYDLGKQTNFVLTLPAADYGNFVQVDFLSGDTAPTLTISASSSALISDFDFVPESNKIYTLFFDYGRLDATNYGWRFSYAEYSYTPESEG